MSNDDDEDKTREAELQRFRMDEDLSAMSGLGLRAEVMKLRALIRLHWKSSGHDLSWFTPGLWQALPEYRLMQPVIEVPPPDEFLAKCQEFRLSLDRISAPPPPKPAEPCAFCKGQGADPQDGRCPLCRPYCERCDQRWDGAVSRDCPQCVPTFPKLEDRTAIKPNETALVEAMRRAVEQGVSYGRMMQLATWEWMHVAPTEALIPSAFEPASTLHLPEKVFSEKNAVVETLPEELRLRRSSTEGFLILVDAYFDRASFALRKLSRILLEQLFPKTWTEHLDEIQVDVGHVSLLLVQEDLWNTLSQPKKFELVHFAKGYTEGISE